MIFKRLVTNGFSLTRTWKWKFNMIQKPRSKGWSREQMKLTEVVVVFFLPFLNESFRFGIWKHSEHHGSKKDFSNTKHYSVGTWKVMGGFLKSGRIKDISYCLHLSTTTAIKAQFPWFKIHAIKSVREAQAVQWLHTVGLSSGCACELLILSPTLKSYKYNWGHVYPQTPTVRRDIRRQSDGKEVWVRSFLMTEVCSLLNLFFFLM